MKKEFNNNHGGTAGINMKESVAKMGRRWLWFLPCALLGIFAGIVYNQYAQNTYEISSTLLLKKDADRASLGSLFSDPKMQGAVTSNADQVGILKSHVITLNALKNLNWEYSWYEENIVNKTDLFLNEPFLLQKKSFNSQALMVPIHVKATSPDTYKVNVDADVVNNGVKQPFKLSKEGKFGELFSSPYFSFILSKRTPETYTTDKEYTLQFNDPSQIAREYRTRMNIVTGDDNSDIIYIKLNSSQPSRDITFLNELANVYIDFGMEEKNKTADNTLKFINMQLASITDSLQVASRDFTNFRSKNKIVNLGQEASMVVENFEEIEREEAASRMKLDYYNNLKGYLNEAKPLKDVVAPSVVGITDPTLNSLVLKLTDLYSQRELLSYSVQEKNPDLVSLDNTIQYTRRILGENLNNLLANTTLELQTMNQRKQKVNTLLSRLPKTEQDLINIKRSFDLNNDLYTFLLRKRAEVGIARASNNPDATVLDAARFDAAVYLGPNKVLNVLTGLVLGLGLPLLFFLLADYFDSRLKNVEEIETQSEIAVAGHIYTNKFKTALPVIQHSNSPITESFRTLRSNLYYLIHKEGLKKVVAIHSPIVGEGKSFIAMNLAAVLAINNKRVLLVESDLRQPRIYLALKMNREIGLTTYLTEKSTYDQIIQPTKIKGLSFVSSGPATTHNSELLNSKLFEKFVQEAKEDYDFVILDSVPSDILSDAVTIGRMADVNFMVLRMNYSGQEQLKSVNKLVQEGTMENMALVLNDVSDESVRKQLRKYGYA